MGRNKLVEAKWIREFPVHWNDEHGERAASFNVAADKLTKLMWKRRQAQDELSKAHGGLKNPRDELESHNREAGALNKTTDVLQSYLTLKKLRE